MGVTIKVEVELFLAPDAFGLELPEALAAAVGAGEDCVSEVVELWGKRAVVVDGAGTDSKPVAAGFEAQPLTASTAANKKCKGQRTL